MVFRRRRTYRTPLRAAASRMRSTMRSMTEVFELPASGRDRTPSNFEATLPQGRSPGSHLVRREGDRMVLESPLSDATIELESLELRHPSIAILLASTGFAETAGENTHPPRYGSFTISCFTTGRGSVRIFASVQRGDLATISNPPLQPSPRCRRSPLRLKFPRSPAHFRKF